MRTRPTVRRLRPLSFLAPVLLICSATVAAQDTPQRAGPDPAGPPDPPAVDKGADPLDPTGVRGPKPTGTTGAPRVPQDWPAWPPTTPSPDGKPGAFVIKLHYGEQATPLNVTVVVPDELPQGEARLPTVIALPPGAGDAKMCEVSRDLYWDAEARARGRLLLVPEIYGKNLQHDGADVAAALYGWLDARVPYDRARVTLAGVSNGGTGAFFLALAAPERIASLLVLPGAYEGPSEDFAKLKDVPVRLMVGGLDTDWQALMQRNLADLQAAGVTADLIVVPDQEHVIHVPPGELFAWIESHEPRGRGGAGDPAPGDPAPGNPSPGVPQGGDPAGPPDPPHGRP